MKTFKRLMQTAGLIGALTSNNLNANAEDQKQESNTQNITYGVRNAIQRQFESFKLTGEFGAYFPQNSDASSQSIFNLDVAIKSNPVNDNHYYITSDLNLVLNSTNNPQLDEFDMFNQIKIGGNFRNFQFLSKCGKWTSGFSLDFHLSYLDQINFDSDPEKSLNFGGGIRYQLDEIFEFRFNYTNTSAYQAIKGESKSSQNLNRDIFELGLILNTTDFYAQFPFVFKADYLTMSPLIGQERIHATMFSILFQTPSQDYDGRLTFEHPIYGTSYSLRRIDKEKVSDPSQEIKDTQTIEDKCPTPLELATISQDLTSIPVINIDKIQTLLKCQSLVNFKVNLDQVGPLKQAIGDFQNFSLEVLIPQTRDKSRLQGSSLYEAIKQIPTARNLNLDAKIDTFARFLISTDQSIKHLHGIPSLRLSKDEQRFMSELSAQADHFFNPSKGAHVQGQKFIYGENLDQKINTNQIAIFDSKLLSYSYMGDHNPERLNRVIQLLDFVSPDISLNVPFENFEYQESLNIASNYHISEVVRLFTPILEKKLPIIIGHHNSIKIQGFKDPIIEGINIAEISSHGKLKLNRLDQFTSKIEFSEDLTQIIITLTMQLDTYANPPAYKITFNKEN